MKYSTFIFTAFLLVIVSSCGSSTNRGFFGWFAPKEIQIGNQTWTTRNLDVETFSNGDPIMHAKHLSDWEHAVNNRIPAWCYYQLEGLDQKTYESYGKLYNWYAVNDPRGLAPEGWRIPSQLDWTEVIDYLGGENHAGMKMKSTRGWNVAFPGNNESGFRALPSGMRNSDGNFPFLGGEAYYWTATEKDSSQAVNVALLPNFNGAFFYVSDKSRGYAVRCIKE
jgi:uncharacterized protein (TIGR02145 family)